MIMTRRGLARQEESKLQLTLKELKVTKERCDQLTAERDDNERELLDVLNKNAKMKNEMSHLHSQYIDAIGARDQLQLLVDSFDICREEYEQTMQRIGMLERQLHHAKEKIADLEAHNNSVVAATNQSLFEELVATGINSATVNNTVPPVFIDLTCDDKPAASVFDCHNSAGIIKCSKNKLKKYIKIRKYITKTKKLIHKHKFFIDSMNLNKQRLQLIDQVNMYSLELDNVSMQYQTDMRALQCEIERLHESLKSMTHKYEMAEKQSREQVLAIGKLVNSCNCNFETSVANISNHSSDCMHSLGYRPSFGPTSMPVLNTQTQQITNGSLSCIEYTRHTHTESTTIMFSDEIGKDMGSFMNHTTGRTMINYCFPNLSLDGIMDKVSNFKFHINTTLLIFVSSRGNVRSLHSIEESLTTYFISQ